MSVGMVINDFSGISEVSIEGLLLQHRKLMLTGEITKESAAGFISRLMCLAIINPSEDVDIYIDSPGGSIDAGLQIIDALKSIEKTTRVSLYCIGECASMAAVILAAGPKRCRFISRHGKTIIHQPLIRGNICKSTSDIKEMAEHLIKTKDEIYQILSDATGKSVEEIEQLTSNGDHMMDAEETVEFGIADEIYDSIF